METSGVLPKKLQWRIDFSLHKYSCVIRPYQLLVALVQEQFKIDQGWPLKSRRGDQCNGADRCSRGPHWEGLLYLKWGWPHACRGHKIHLIGLIQLLVEWPSSLFQFCTWFLRVIALRFNACLIILGPLTAPVTYWSCSLLPQWLCTYCALSLECSSFFYFLLLFLQCPLNDHFFGKSLVLGIAQLPLSSWHL